MATLILTEQQLRLVQTALDFYARIGIGQFDHIKDHPTFERHVNNMCIPKKEPEVGDRTNQGEILEIKKGKALISGSVKDGMWNEEHEWKPLKEVQLSTDYNKYHALRDDVDAILGQARNKLYGQEYDYLSHRGSWGINHPNVDDSCRVAFDIVQVIRHEFWKRDPKRSNITVDSSIHFTNRKNNSLHFVRCELDDNN
jgi:hypothetical protein